MHESKQKQVNSKSQVNSQTRDELQAEEGFFHQEDSLVQQLSGAGNLPDTSVHAQMMSRIPANPELLLQMQQQFGNSHVSQVVQMARESSRQTSQQPVIQAKQKIGATQRSPLQPQQLPQHSATKAPSASGSDCTVQEKDEMTGDRQVSLEVSRPNKTGLPDRLKTSIENLSGYSMDDVKVHYNSDKPAQVQARAYTQGTDIYLGSGQKKHLPHEAWHVVQQKQGRVKPTTMISDMPVNDNPYLETEATTMGEAAMQGKSIVAGRSRDVFPSLSHVTLQREIDSGKTSQELLSIISQLEQLENEAKRLETDEDPAPRLSQLTEKIATLKKIATGKDEQQKAEVLQALKSECNSKSEPSHTKTDYV